MQPLSLTVNADVAGHSNRANRQIPHYFFTQVPLLHRQRGNSQAKDKESFRQPQRGCIP
jgi:hypothetical protein